MEKDMEDLLFKKIIEGVKKDPLKKYILSLLNSDNNAPINGTTKFMKELFFVSKNIPVLEEEADFEPDNFGPSSDAVANVLHELSMLGLVDTKKEYYHLSDYGEQIIKTIEDLPDKDKNVIDFMKNLFKNLSYDESLALVYCNYPEMTSESLVKDRIKFKRKNLALSLLRKGKITKAKAAEIYGVPLRDFYNILQDKGIQIELV